ncbi:ABC transporter permease [Tardiphaga sp. 709]|jgi:phospholipid/cholesterol/gamma-HCH transport system permease protein|uniref:MlaE family ABC transporter permease n=1 Tax=unclassified Tardiphaga TaxID=2631404 RepID=UPI0028EFA234|nr:ABC transporter permease [Tardiphaga sp. 709]WNV11903.1 ABC transporter permease [Tardiphaga sp. 709]
MNTPLLIARANGDALELCPTGSWTVVNAATLEQLSASIAPQLARARSVTVNMSGVRELDTLGAWLIERISRHLAGGGQRAHIVGAAEDYIDLIEELRQVNRRRNPGLTERKSIAGRLEMLGRAALAAILDLSAFLQMLGAICLAAVGVLRRPRSFRLTSLVYQIYRVGWQALPIVVLITFLIGAIIAQQGIFHFRKFGAEAYVVDMVGILVLRELGVLIVAIMVAGRSGSAYTAELGSMKMREEIDALSTMGLDPVDVLILPRVVALIVALPILAFVGAVAALYGGGLVAWFYGGMSPVTFIARLHEAISVTHFEVGIIKAPFMALVIGIVACSEGLRVKGSAESLGKQTTTSVVKSIFLVIVLDGLFAVFFASIGM